MPKTSSPKRSSQPVRIRFADFEVDLRSRELLSKGQRISIQDKPFEVLLALLERPGEVVLREELQERLWPGRIVEFDNNLNTALTKLRLALGDDANAPRLVETVPRRGYRLLGTVEAVQEPGPKHPPLAPSARRRRISWRRWALAGVALATAWVATEGFRLASDGSDSRLQAIATEPGNTPEAVDAPLAPHREALLLVLPLRTSQPHGEAAHLAETFTENVITELARRLPPEIGVIARASSLRYDSPAVDLWELRTRLGVDYVLEGRLDLEATGADTPENRVAGIRVSVRFIHLADQAHLWAASYQADLSDLWMTERVVAERIVNTVAPGLNSADSARPVEAPNRAWRSYLAGRQILGRLRRSEAADASEAVAHLRQAVQSAPDMAVAWATLADALSWQPGPPRPRLEEAQAAARRALELDPTLAQAHLRLGYLALYFDWDWQTAARELDQAAAIAPHLASVHHVRAALFSSRNQHRQALTEIDRALRLDPLSVILQADAGWYLYVARQYEAAAVRCREALELDPDHRGANSYLLRSLLALGEQEEAAEVARRLLEVEGADANSLARASGSPEAALDELTHARLERLEREYREGRASPAALALARLDAGDLESVLPLLREGLEQRWGWIYPFVPVYPDLDPLRGRPDFGRLESSVVPP